MEQPQNESERVPSGPAAAAFLAAGIGCTALGLFTTASEASEPLLKALNWYNPVGPLSGKTGLAVILWVVAWVVLHQVLKRKDPDIGKVLIGTLVLVGLGFLGTFPLFYDLFLPAP